MSEWRPIETAPKDGTHILAAFVWRNPENEPAGVHSIRWHESWGEWTCSSVLIRFDNSGDPDDDAYPVKWMPLPEA